MFQSILILSVLLVVLVEGKLRAYLVSSKPMSYNNIFYYCAFKGGWPAYIQNEVISDVAHRLLDSKASVAYVGGATGAGMTPLKMIIEDGKIRVMRTRAVKDQRAICQMTISKDDIRKGKVKIVKTAIVAP